MKVPRWAVSRRDRRSHLLDDGPGHALTLVARCGHEIDTNHGIDVNTERARHMVPCASCAAMLVLELLRELEVSDTEAREWLAR